jgi:hypothetical protein
VAEEGVTFRDIAFSVATGLGLDAVSVAPDKAAEHFGWFALFAGEDMSASSTLTRNQLGWEPTGPGLLQDLATMDYSAIAS